MVDRECLHHTDTSDLSKNMNRAHTNSSPSNLGPNSKINPSRLSESDECHDTRSAIEHYLPISGLKLDTRQLEGILQNLALKISHHERKISRLPKLEKAQSNFQSNLNKFQSKLCLIENSQNIECVSHNGKLSMDNNDSTSLLSNAVKNKYDGSVKPNPKLLNTGNVVTSALDVVEAIEEEENTIFMEPIIHSQSNAITTKNKFIREMQKMYDNSFALSKAAYDRVEWMKVTLVEFERKLNFSVNPSDLVDLRYVIHQNANELNQFINDFKRDFKFETDVKVNNKLLEITGWFKILEERVVNEQSKIKAQIPLFAKDADLVLLHNEVEIDVAVVKDHLRLVDENTIMNKQAILGVKQKIAFNIFHRHIFQEEKKMAKSAWSTWSTFIIKKKEAMKLLNIRCFKIRKLLMKRRFYERFKVWIKWKKFNDHRKSIEQYKEQLLKLIIQKMHKYTSEVMIQTFKQWHRSIVSEKIKYSCEKETVTLASSTLSNEDTACHRTFWKYDLSSLLKTFKNDHDGAIQTLAQEISKIRSHDIDRLEKNWQIGQQTFLAKFSDFAKMISSKFDMKYANMEDKVKERLNKTGSDMHSVRSQVLELRTTIYGTVSRVNTIRESHGERIELLCEGKDIIDDKIFKMQTKVHESNIRIKDLEVDNEKYVILVNKLQQQILNNKSLLEEQQSKFESDVTAMRKELELIKSCICSSNESKQKLENLFISTNNNIIQAKITSERNLDNVHKILNSHGLSKPNLDLIIEDAVIYEKLANDRNYVVALNSVTSDAKEIDICGHIAAFAYDYAYWIAYQVDYEALLGDIAGNNPDQIIYTEENTELRRKDLIAWLVLITVQKCIYVPFCLTETSFGFKMII